MSRPYSRSSLGLAFAGIVVALTFAGCSHLPGQPGPGPEVPRPGEVLDFNTLYQQNCSACHGAAGKGGAAVSLADPRVPGLGRRRHASTGYRERCGRHADVSVRTPFRCHANGSADRRAGP